MTTYASAAALASVQAGFGALLDKSREVCGPAWCVTVATHADARGRGFRCVRVIHGKGLSSANREPVLKNKVRRWLSQWDEVLAYCEAPRHGGGGGAVVVLLKAAPA